MWRQSILAVSAMALTALGAGPSAARSSWTHGAHAPTSAGPTPTPDYALMAEAVLVEMNELRFDPGAYARKLAHHRTLYRGKTIFQRNAPPVLTQEGVTAVDEAIAALRQTQRLPQLRWADGLARAAQDHADDLGRNNLTGHGGSDGSRPEERSRRYGDLEVVHAENITFGSMTGREVVIDLLIDDGVAGRGHREILLAPQLRVTGVACGPHPSYRITCVVEYAGGFRPHGEAAPRRADPQRATTPRSPYQRRPWRDPVVEL